FAETVGLETQMERIVVLLPTLDEMSVRKAITRSVRLGEIEDEGERREQLITVFLSELARNTLGDQTTPTFAGEALAHAGIRDAQRQATFARLLGKYQRLTDEAVEELRKDLGFSKAEIADLRTSYRLSELTRAEFATIRIIKDGFGVRDPADIRG